MVDEWNEETKDLIHEGIATPPFFPFSRLLAAEETKDLIHEGIATALYEISLCTDGPVETKDLIHEGIATSVEYLANRSKINRNQRPDSRRDCDQDFNFR